MNHGDANIGHPIRNLQTMLRVIAIQHGEGTPLIPDGIYGPQTAAAVSRFQRAHALPPTGTTDQETWETIVSVYENASLELKDACPLHIFLLPGKQISRGAHGPYIAMIQGMLFELSDSCGSIRKPSISGIWDESTAESIASFQKLCDLPVTGHCDKCTWKNLALHYPLLLNMLENGNNTME